MMKPDRSDKHLTPEEEAMREAAAREYFDGVVPKRHTKPQRSDYSSTYTDQIPPSNASSIPELRKFRDLESHPETLVCESPEPEAEYVETEYYQDLNGVDKQHHRTGTGFIKVNSGGDCFDLDSGKTTTDGCGCGRRPSSKGNPATNEWTPSDDSVNIPAASDKPNRSDI